MFFLTIENLIQWNIEIGNKKIYKSSLMNRYILTIRNEICIINLEYTLFMLQRALSFIVNTIQKRGNIFIILDTKYIDEELFLTEKFLKEPWIGGMLTNRKRIYILKTYNINYTFLPSAVILLRNDDKKYYILNEAMKLKVPIISLMDTNMVPEMAFYPIPSNNKDLSINNYYVEIFINAILLGFYREKILFNLNLKLKQGLFSKKNKFISNFIKEKGLFKKFKYKNFKFRIEFKNYNLKKVKLINKNMKLIYQYLWLGKNRRRFWFARLNKYGTIGKYAKARKIRSLILLK